MITRLYSISLDLKRKAGIFRDWIRNENRKPDFNCTNFTWTSMHHYRVWQLTILLICSYIT